MISICNVLPILPLRGIVLLPNNITNFEIGRQKSIATVQYAIDNNKQLFVTAQKQISEEEVRIDNIYLIGVIAEIRQSVKLPNGNIRIVLEGIKRAKISNITENSNLLEAEIFEREEILNKNIEVEALIKTLIYQFNRWARLSKKIAPESIENIIAIKEIHRFADIITNALPFSFEEKQELLEMLDVKERLVKICEKLITELEIAELENKIHTRVRDQIDRNQKEYYLREQIKAIQKELDEKEGNGAEAEEIRKKLKDKKLPEKVLQKVLKEIERFEKMPSIMPEGAVIRNYLDWIVNLPWIEESEDDLDIKKVRNILNEDHYGLIKIKERIVEYLAVRKLNKNAKGVIICFVGPPGVGKTSLAKSIARALSKNFVRISLGGIKDEAEIRGHRRTYVSALPGKIINGIRKASTGNPVFLLDEIDKLSSDYRGDPASAMLEVLDPEQNNSFIDHYLEIPFDLSKVFWIATANNFDNIPHPLLDRMEIITLSGYTFEEKIHIAKKFLTNKQQKENGLADIEINLSDNVLCKLITQYTKEAGVRNLERNLAKLFRKLALIKLSNIEIPIISQENLKNFFGPPKYLDKHDIEKPQIGVATGLAWTEAGGDVLPIEASVMNGKGALMLTGHLGEIMQESAKAGFTYIRTRATKLGIKNDFYEKDDIHIHCPEGAIPKDGPSAGITMATAMASALTGKFIRSDLAMTGEITLRGRILPVGGIKEKVLAAHYNGIKTVLLPHDNNKDIEEIPEEIRNDLEIVLVEHMDDVLNNAFIN